MLRLVLEVLIEKERGFCVGMFALILLMMMRDLAIF
jgi:hypothetical protein